MVLHFAKYGSKTQGKVPKNNFKPNMQEKKKQNNPS